MTGFDRFIIVDWSGGNDTGPRPRRDAIWIGENGCAPLYMRNRGFARDWIADRIARALGRDERLCIGFDFPFGYPRGFARALTGRDTALAFWRWLAARIEDAPRSNNRFDVAAGINLALGQGRGPFWANALKRDIHGLARTKAGYANPFPDRRHCETLAKGSFTCWQLAGAGSVGSQVLMGLPVLWQLYLRFAGKIAVWPFEALDRPVAFVEVWPSLWPEAVRRAEQAGEIRDAAQVRLTADWLAGLAPAALAAMLRVDAPEEGWILGLETHS